MQEYVFCSLSGCQKRVCENKCELFAFVVLAQEEEIIRKKLGKGHFHKMPREIVFWGGCEQISLSLQKWHFLKNRQTPFVFGANTICVLKVKPTFSLQLSVFGNGPVLFCAHSNSPNTTKIGASAGFKSSILGRGLERGLTICDT